jgi:succinate-acetate transporter protein
MTFLTLMISEFSGSPTILNIGGGFGLATAAVSFYLGAAQLLDEDNSWFTLPVIPFGHARND